MIDSSKLKHLTREQLIDIIQCKVAVARKALELAKGESPEVISMLQDYVVEAEALLEKSMWGLR